MPSEPLAQVDIEAEIVRLSGLCEKVTHELAQRARMSAEADAAFKREYAKAYLRSEAKTAGARDAQAVLATDEQYTAKRIAEALLQSATEAGRNYRAQLDALRSINANIRHQVSN